MPEHMDLNYSGIRVDFHCRPANEREAEDCRSLKDIKEMIKRKADELDGKMLDAGGVCIGLYFAIANDLPSVTPKSDKHSGKWEHISYYDGGYGMNETCSNCGCTIHGQIFDLVDKYCPHCGAKMVELQESEVEDGNDD